MVELVQSVFRGDHSALKNKIAIRERLAPENFVVEREKIFRRSWLCICHALDLPEAGSYHVVDVPTFKTSLLVVRGADGAIEAFHNICRHRGNKLVRSGQGRRLNFACGFHGWVYANSGALVNVPDEPQFLNFDK